MPTHFVCHCCRSSWGIPYAKCFRLTMPLAWSYTGKSWYDGSHIFRRGTLLQLWMWDHCQWWLLLPHPLAEDISKLSHEGLLIFLPKVGTTRPMMRAWQWGTVSVLVVALHALIMGRVVPTLEGKWEDLGDLIFEDILCQWGGVAEVITDNGPHS